jgi:hypothetical protein
MAKRKERADARPCEHCEEPFRPWKVDGKYCSRRCTQQAASARRLEAISVERPDSHSLAWAAGFFDGEGCFHATTSNYYDTSEGRKCRRYLRLDVSQKYDPLLLQLRHIFGVGSINYQKPRPGRSAGYKWVCNGRAALFVADLLWPWLGEQKKADFKRAIKAIRETRSDFVRRPQHGRRIRVIERS